MRKKMRKQLPLTVTSIEHRHAKELEGMSEILERNPIIYDLALQDLRRKHHTSECGAEGMSAEQVVRAAIIKQMEGYSYEDLAFHLVDSICYRDFCRIGIANKGFKKTALSSNIKSLSAETWEAINRVLVGDAEKNDIEKGREVRTDCTVVSTDIHEPSDSSLLWDSNRVITRLLLQAKEGFPALNLHMSDHTKRAKRRTLAIMNAKDQKTRKEHYKDLLKVTHKTLGYASSAVPLLREYRSPEPMQVIRAQAMAEQLQDYIQLTSRVIEQTERRVLHGEVVPASEKIVSIFEPHTDILVKDNRETHYGHKICLSTGSSNLILDCLILDGNPADSTLTIQMLARQEEIYGRPPLKAALDGGFASKSNLEAAKAMGIKDVCFAKRRGVDAKKMCRSDWVYKRLRRFRAGIESAISWLKRCFGFARCTWKSLRSFKSYVWASIVAANLLTLARKQLA